MKNKPKTFQKKEIPFFSKEKIWYIIPKSVSPIGIFSAKLGVIALVITFLSAIIFPIINSICSKSSIFNPQIQITNWKNYQENFLPYIKLEIDGKTIEEQINKEGIAKFTDIKGKYNKKEVPIEITHTEGMPYFFENKTITLQKDSVNKINVQLRGLERLEAIVVDFDTKEILPNARVTCADTIIVTNNKGELVIDISLEKQEKAKRVKIQKEGYDDFNEFISFVEKSKPKIFYLKKKK